MEGSLSLTLAPVDGRTRPTRLVAVPPLQCSRARYDDHQHPDVVSLTLLHLGGVLQGDRLHLDITLQPKAAACLTTAAATQIYRMPERAAAQTTNITLQRGARLAYLPEPTILFAGARFTQTTCITLHKEATLILRELLVCGRLARGELHQYQRYGAQFEVLDANARCLLAERTRMEPKQFSPAAIGIQDVYPVVGSLYMLALDINCGAILATAQQALDYCRDVSSGVGILPNSCGVLVRVLGNTAQAVRTALDAVRQQVFF